MKRLYTPQTPVTFFFILALLNVLSLNNTNGQAIEIKPLKAYELSLKSYYNRKWTADRREFKTLNMKGWYYYLPSVGFSFGLPSVQFSTRDYLNFRREKKINEAKLEMLDSKSELEFNQNIQVLRNMYLSLNFELDKVKAYQRKKEIKYKIWAITQEGCKKNEISPKDCYLAKLEELEYLEAEKVLESSFNQKILELEIFARFEMPKEKIYFVQSECIMESEEFDLFKEERKINVKK